MQFKPLVSLESTHTSDDVDGIEAAPVGPTARGVVQAVVGVEESPGDRNTERERAVRHDVGVQVDI